MSYETKQRSIVKALSWRLIAVTITSSIVYLITGETKAAVQVGLIDTVLKLAAYFGHERLWLRVRWGVKRYRDYQI